MTMTPRARTTSSTSRPSALRRWAPWAVLAVTALVYVATFSRGYVSVDVWSADFGAWHISQSGNPWVDGLSMPPLQGNPFRYEWVTHALGHQVIARSPGVIAASLPAYRLLGNGGFSVLPGDLSAALLTAVSALLVYLVVERRRGPREAMLVALAFAFTTPIWSVAANGMWPHTLTVLGIAGMAWSADRDRWWLTGLFGGITLWGRLHAAFIVAILGVVVSLRRRQLAPALRTGLVSALFLVLMSAWTHWMYGTWNPTASYDVGPFEHYDHYSISNQLGMWVSFSRGLLVWTPVLIVVAPAIARSWRELPDWSRALLYGGLAYTVLQAALNRFSGGESFYGYRLTLEMLACATPAAAFSIPRMKSLARRLVGPVLAVQLLAIAAGAISNGGYISNAHHWYENAFVVVINRLGIAGYVTLALTAGLGALAGRVWARTTPLAPDEGPAAI